MAIYRSVTRREPGTLDGKPVVWFRKTGEYEEVRCYRCGGEADKQLCHSCWPTGKLHHHGLVHVHDAEKNRRGSLEAMCNICHPEHVAELHTARQLTAS